MNLGELGGEIRILIGKGFHDDLSGFFFVFTLDLGRGHRPGAGDLSVEVVGVGGAHGHDALTGLGKTDRPAGVGVNDAADVGESLIELQMGGRIAGGTKISFHDLSVQADHDHIFRT